jgi:hypothetical protein
MFAKHERYTEMIEQLKRIAGLFLSITAVLLILSITTPTGDLTQGDVNFRLINIERRLDQMQQRVDFVERTLQNQSLNNRPSDLTSSTTTTALLEMERKQLSLAQQVALLERRMLEMQKTIDRLHEVNQETKETKETKEPKDSKDTKATPKSEPKPKPKQ